MHESPTLLMQGQTPTRCIKTLVAGLHAIKLILLYYLCLRNLPKFFLNFCFQSAKLNSPSFENCKQTLPGILSLIVKNMEVYGLSLIQPSYNMICKDLDVLGGEFMRLLQSC
jgi:hypothetical protein